MSGTQPVEVYGLKIPAGDILIPATADWPASFRVTMAAIDPTETPYDDDGKQQSLRSTLKLVRIAGDVDDSEDDSEDFDEEENDSEDEEEEPSSDEDEVNGGPSDPEKVKKAQEAAAAKDEDSSDEDDDEDGPIDIEAALKRIAKGKAISNGDDDDSSDVSLESGLEEFVICTLDPEKFYQQPLDIVCNEHEKIFFKVSGTHSIYLTGNYVMEQPLDGEDDYEEEDEYDLSPDEDEIEMGRYDEDESDELDDAEMLRITELDSDEELVDAPQLVQATKKGKNKRPAEDSESDEEIAATLDEIIAKSVKLEPLTNGEAKLSKKERKKLKKLNSGEAADASVAKETTGAAPPKSDKKVQFADNLEQGPTNSAKESKKSDKKAKTLEGGTKKSDIAKAGEGKKAVSNVKDIKGVKIDDRTPGKGSGAKKGNRVQVRYIGKLENGHVFDSNKKGKPFTVRLGAGEVIQGWDIGLAGMAVGGERRITIPPHLAYGSKSQAGIPANSTLTFDIKMLAID